MTRLSDGLMIGILIDVLEAAVVEARTVPRLLGRDGLLFWRAPGGGMVQLTIPHGARLTAVTDTTCSWDVA